MSTNPNHDDENARFVRAMEKSKRDLNAFLPIYEAYVEKIYSYCRHRVQSVQDAEDLTSQVFARAMTKRHTFSGGNVGAWLFQIAYHISIDHYRSRKINLVSDEVLDSTGDDRQRAPLETLIYKERIELLERWLDDLPEDKRNILLLRITGGLSSVEIGAIIGKSASSVRVEIHRIIQQLKQNALQDQS